MTLETVNLTLKRDRRLVVNNITFSFIPGLIYGLIGPNGAGKTTFCKLLTGLLNPTEGKISWRGNDLERLSRRERSQTISLVPQNPLFYFDITSIEMVAMGRYPHGMRTSDAEEVIVKVLHQVDAWHLRNKPISQLSGGEKQRIYIARALATQAAVLLLDEPTSSLDLRHQYDIWSLLNKIKGEDRVIITAIHDLHAAKKFCDHLIILNQGEFVASGPYTTVMTPAVLEEIFGLAPGEY